jgi:hypothetical protein
MPPYRSALPALVVVVLLVAGALGGVANAQGGSSRPAQDLAPRSVALLGNPPFNAVWQASSAVRPDSTCPVWLMTASDSVPEFTGGSMRIHTTDFSKNVFFRHLAADLAIPETLVVEVRLRFGSGTDVVGPCGHYRQAANVAITTSGSNGVLFFVGDGEIFLTRGECAGIISLSVPTADAAHTYRITIVGTQVVVRRDGVPALTGSTYTSVADNGTSPRILWGEGSSLAYGTSYWEYVKHNAHASGCPTTDVPSGAQEADAGSGVVVRSWPNPSHAGVRIEWTLAKASHVRADVFDLSGRLVRRLLEAHQTAGAHGATWDRHDAAGLRMPPGAYLCRVESGSGTATARLVLTP